MRKFLSYISLTTISLLLMTSFSSAQKDFDLGHFTATEVKGKVFLSWSVKQGNTCNNINIFRSYDNIIFENIGEIFGICGSVSETLSYSFTDEQPQNNSVNYYKLTFGDFDESEIITIRIIDIENNKHLVQPNPIIDKAKIYFNNPQNEEYQLSIYQINGTLASKSISETDYFEINMSNAKSGIYLFFIKTEKGTFNTFGKLIVM